MQGRQERLDQSRKRATAEPLVLDSRWEIILGVSLIADQMSQPGANKENGQMKRHKSSPKNPHTAFVTFM